MKDMITRRRFIGKVFAAAGLIAGAGRIKTAWSATGSDKGSIRLVYYTDVHARTE
jgi:hypothetical protein